MERNEVSLKKLRIWIFSMCFWQLSFFLQHRIYFYSLFTFSTRCLVIAFIRLFEGIPSTLFMKSEISVFLYSSLLRFTTHFQAVGVMGLRKLKFSSFVSDHSQTLPMAFQWLVCMRPLPCFLPDVSYKEG